MTTLANRSRIDAALLLLRLGLGGVMIPHGAQKLFVFGFAGVAQSFHQMGIPGAEFMGPFIALVEFFGGIAVVLGLLTRLAALGLACDMLGAIAFVHFKNGFFNPKGFEFPLSLAIGYLTLVLAGAGSYSIDAAIARRRFSSSPEIR